MIRKKGPVAKKKRSKKSNRTNRTASKKAHAQSKGNKQANPQKRHNGNKPKELGTVLKRIVDQIDDSDQSNSETLQNMQQRLEVLSEQTHAAKNKNEDIDTEATKTIDRIENQISNLSDRIEIISQGQAISTRREILEERIEELALKVSDNEANAKETEAQHQETQKADTSKNELDNEADITFSVTPDIDSNIDLGIEKSQKEKVSKKKSEKQTEKQQATETKSTKKKVTPQSEDVSAQQSNKKRTSEKNTSSSKVEKTQKNARPQQKSLLDASPAITSNIAPDQLASLAEHFSPVIEQKKTPETKATKKSEKEQPKTKPFLHKAAAPTHKQTSNNNGLEKRFAIIASKLEETLDQRASELNERIEIAGKFDNLSNKLEELLNKKNDQRSFNIIEKKLNSLDQYVQQAEQNASRIGKIEEQLVKLVELVEQSQSSNSTITPQDFEKIATHLFKEKTSEIKDSVSQFMSENISKNSSTEELKEIQSSVTELNTQYLNANEENKLRIDNLDKSLQKISTQLENLAKQPPEKTDGEFKEDTFNIIDDSITEREHSEENQLSKALSSRIEAIQEEDINMPPQLPETNDIHPSFEEDLQPTKQIANETIEVHHSVTRESNTSQPMESTEDFIAAARRAAMEATEKQKQLLEQNTSSENDMQESSSHANAMVMEPSERLETQESSPQEQENSIQALRRKFFTFDATNTSSILVVTSMSALVLSAAILINELSLKRPTLTAKHIETNTQALQVEKAATKAQINTPSHKKNVQQAESKSLTESNRVKVQNNELSSEGPQRQEAKQTPLEARKITSIDNKNSSTTAQKNTIKNVHQGLRRTEQNKAQQTTANNTSAQLVTNSDVNQNNETQQLIQTQARKEQGIINAEVEKNLIVHNTSHSKSLPPAKIGPYSLRLAAANGDAKAQFKVAMRFIEGRSVQKNYRNAIRWLKRAASKSYAPAQYHLATMYERGTGTEKDLGKAKTWYHQAANNGNVKAMHNLGVMYTSSSESQTDYAAASLWFLKAANHGLTDSQYNLGILYKNGMGVEKNLSEAYKWFTLAGQHGDNQAVVQRNKLKIHMSGHEIISAERALINWKKRTINKKANSPKVAYFQKAAHKQITSPKKVKPVDPLILETQILLQKLGFEIGHADGKLGSKTRNAILEFQKKLGIKKTGKITPGLIKKLRSKVSS